MTNENILILMQRQGRQQRIVGKDVSISAGLTKEIINISGKTGSILGGNIIFENHSVPLHDIEIELAIDGLTIFSEDIEWMKKYKIRKEESNPVYLIKYCEDATTFGSWIDYSYATFKYIVGLNPSPFQNSCFLSVKNTTSIDITISYLIQYTTLVEKA